MQVTTNQEEGVVLAVVLLAKQGKSLCDKWNQLNGWTPDKQEKPESVAWKNHYEDGHLEGRCRVGPFAFADFTVLPFEVGI